MIPGKYNIVCPQGSTFQQQLIYKIDDVVVDLTGYDARMQVREKHTSKSSVLDLNVSNGGLAVDSQGAIDITISATTTAALIAKEYVYDIEIISSGSVVTRLLEGRFMVTPEVTR